MKKNPQKILAINETINCKEFQEFISRNPHSSFVSSQRHTQKIAFSDIKNIEPNQILKIIKIIVQGIHHLHKYKYCSIIQYKSNSLFIGYIRKLKQQLSIYNQNKNKTQIKQFITYFFVPNQIIYTQNPNIKIEQIQSFGKICLQLIYNIQNIENDQLQDINVKKIKYKNQQKFIDIIKKCLSSEHQDQPSAYTIRQFIKSFIINQQKQEGSQKHNKQQQSIFSFNLQKQYNQLYKDSLGILTKPQVDKTLKQLLIKNPHSSFIFPERYQQTIGLTQQKIENMGISQKIGILKVIINGIYHLHKLGYSSGIDYKQKNQQAKKIKLHQYIRKLKETNVRFQQNQLQKIQSFKYIFQPYKIFKTSQQKKIQREIETFGLICLMLIYRIKQLGYLSIGQKNQQRKKIFIGELRKYPKQQLLIYTIEQCLAFKHKDQPSAFKIINIIEQVMDSIQIQKQNDGTKKINQRLQHLNRFYSIYELNIKNSKQHIIQYDLQDKLRIKKAFGKNFLENINEEEINL